MKAFFIKLSVFISTILLSCIGGSSYAACSGGGSGPGYTPPSPSAVQALDLLNNKTPTTPSQPVTAATATPGTTPPAGTPPGVKTEAEAPVTAAVTPTATPPTVTPPAAKPPEIAGKVAWVKGTLKVVGADKKVRTLQTGSPIYPGDSIVTDKGSQAQVVFSDHSLMTFDKSTVFNVTKYDYHPKEAKSSGSVGTFVGNLIVGTYRTVTGAIPKAKPKDYQVNTEVAVMGVAGTDYSASFQSCNVNMKRNEGTPILTNAKGTITLTPSTPFAGVNSANQPPVRLLVQPVEFRSPLRVVRVNFATIRTMPPLNSGGGGGGGVCGPAGGGFSVKFR